MARVAGIEPKRFRNALRRAGLRWHGPGEPWLVEIGTARHADLKNVLKTLSAHRVATRQGAPIAEVSIGREVRDEVYIMTLCDLVLGESSRRQYRFDALRGDPGKRGVGACLPVDAYYPSLNLVIEYHERQHTEAVAFFDGRITASNMSRGEQRARYDQRRRDVLAHIEVRLLELDYSEFPHRPNKRLIRSAVDRDIIARRVALLV